MLPQNPVITASQCEYEIMYQFYKFPFKITFIWPNDHILWSQGLRISWDGIKRVYIILDIPYLCKVYPTAIIKKKIATFNIHDESLSGLGLYSQSIRSIRYSDICKIGACDKYII